LEHLDTVTFNSIWLVVFLVAGVSALRLKDDKRNLATNIFIVLMTVFVGCKYYQSIFVENRLNANKTVDVEKAELVLRIASAVSNAAQSARETADMLGKLQRHKSLPNALKENVNPFGQAEEIIEKAVQADPQSISAVSKLIVVKHESKESISSSMEKLGRIETGEAQALHSCLHTIYDGRVALDQFPLFEQIIQRDFGPGWYQDYLLESLYKQNLSRVREHESTTGEHDVSNSGNDGSKTSTYKQAMSWLREGKQASSSYDSADKEYAALKTPKASKTSSKVRPELRNAHEELIRKNSLIVAKMVVIVAFGVSALLTGVILIFVQLLFVARRKGGADESYMVKAPVQTSVRTIYGVFIAWLTTQYMVSAFLQVAMKPLVPYLKGTVEANPSGSKPLLIALMVAVLYAATNGPGTLYAYLFAMRPHKIGFFEGFRLRAKVGKRGPFFLALMGLGTWFVAVPLVLVATFIGSKFLNSQGSNNPIIGLILEAARSGNPVSTIFFYLTLAVLAPICEETLFRGFLYANLRRTMGVFPSMAISAALFAAFHMDVGAFLPLFTLGSLFALVFEKHKSILPSMVAHGLWNGGTFTALLLLAG
jgi:membrane protease YdiL (CAAX protease family)